MKDERTVRSRAQEDRAAKLHGGSRNSGSGSGPWRKNDVRVGTEYLIEYKTTTGKNQSQITIKAKDTEDVWQNAILEGREPAFGIEVGGRDWVMVTADEFERLRGIASASTTGSDNGTLHRGEESRLLLSGSGEDEQGLAQGSKGGLQRAARRPSKARLPGKGLVP